MVAEPDQRTLFAFYTGVAGAAPALRRALSGRLPPYMVPTRFVWMTQMPLNLNGKVDRRRLTAEVDRR